MASQFPSNACFDCSICLELAEAPVVTLCGHLYCWHCIYRWLRLDKTSPRKCPVCKSLLSLSSLIRLYSRGCSTSDQAHQRLLDIPRPPKYFNGHASGARGLRNRNGPYYSPYGDSLNVGSAVGGIAMGVFSWMLGVWQAEEAMSMRVSRRYYDGAGGGRMRGRRGEVEMRSYLHQIWVFLFCCVVFCLLLF